MRQEDVKSLCDEAENSWRNAGANQTVVSVIWRGEKYISTLTGFRILVKTPDGKPVACRGD